MQINLGEKIKYLRKRDGRKQDDLADALGVTSQAVSRWESNKGYPDLELIPTIANYFHVTIDELFGYDNDRNIRLSECLKKADDMNTPGATPTKRSIEELETFLREALSEFPNEWQLQMRLSVALQLKSSFVDEDQKAKTADLEEAASLLNRAQRNTEEAHWKDSIRQSLARIYNQLGDGDRIEEMATESSPAYVCRELILTNTPDNNKAKVYLEKALLSLLHETVFVSVKSCSDGQKPEFSDKKDVYLSLIRIFESIFAGKEYGFFHSDMHFLYLHAFRISAMEGKKKEAQEFFDKAYDHALGFEKAWAGRTDDNGIGGSKCISDYPGTIVFVDKNSLNNYI